MQLSEVDPLDFGCKFCTWGVDEVGVQWSCGHISCCGLGNLRPTKDETLQSRSPTCIYEECRDQESPPGPVVVGLRSFEAHRSNSYNDRLSQFFPYERNYCEAHEDIELCFFLRSPSPLAHKPHCLLCLQNLFPPATLLPVDALITITRNLKDFRNAYNTLDRCLALLGLELGFRGELDAVAAAWVAEFASTDFLDMLDGPPNLSFYQPTKEDSKERWAVEDRRLRELGTLLNSLAVSLRTHAQSIRIRRLAKFLKKFIIIPPEAENLVPSPSIFSETTQELRRLFAQHWPVQTLAETEKPPTYSSTFDCQLLAVPLNKSTVRQLSALRHHRNLGIWKKIANQSAILRSTDLSFLGKEITPIKNFRRLISSDEGDLDPKRFSDETQGKRGLLLLIESPGRRFGFYSPVGFASKKISGWLTTFLFSLTPPNILRADSSAGICVLPGSHTKLFSLTTIEMALDEAQFLKTLVSGGLKSAVAGPESATERLVHKNGNYSRLNSLTKTMAWPAE